MKISVIVPVFNVEKYFEQCMTSLLNQTYKPFEIILVDDESSDSSGVMADMYAQMYDFVTVIHKKNAGLGFARNTGIENAKGEWIVFLDSDDYFSENLLQVLVEKQKLFNADVVIGGYKRVNNEGEILFEYKYSDEVYHKKDVINNLLPRFLGSSPMKSDSISMSVCNCLFSLDIISRFNIRFPSERYVISEDLFFNFDYYYHANTVVLTSSTEYFYRTTQGSLTTKYRRDRYLLSKNLYFEMLERINKNNLSIDFKYRLMRSMFNYWRMCFAQEQRSISNNSLKELTKNIKAICEDGLTRDILDEYPMNALNFKQKFFLYFVKHKCIYLLSFLIEIGFFRIA